MAKKMKLISEELYNKLINNQHKTSFESQNESNAMQMLNSNVPDDIKLPMYMQIIREFITKNISKLHPSTPTSPTAETQKEIIPEKETEVSEDNDTENILCNFFKERHRSTVKYIIKLLQDHPDLISWNDKLEVTFMTDQFCPGSSILDLLSYLIRDLKWDIAPRGANRFLLICKLLNIPSSMMRKGLRAKMGADLEDMTSVKSASDSTSDFPELRDKVANWISVEDEYFTDDDGK